MGGEGSACDFRLSTERPTLTRTTAEALSSWSPSRDEEMESRSSDFLAPFPPETCHIPPPVPCLGRRKGKHFEKPDGTYVSLMDDRPDRRMSESSAHSRPDIDEAPAKSVFNPTIWIDGQLITGRRMRTDAKVEDKARGKRLFGNLLGTLQKFKNDDRSSRTSEAASPPFLSPALNIDVDFQAKRREQVSERIATKLRSEATLHHEIAESEKELKTLRIATDSADFVLKHKDAAVRYPTPA